jgi:hypothetical protein
MAYGYSFALVRPSLGDGQARNNGRISTSCNRKEGWKHAAGANCFGLDVEDGMMGVYASVRLRKADVSQAVLLLV